MIVTRPPTAFRYLGDPFVAILAVAGAIALVLGDRVSGLTIIALVSLGSLLSTLPAQPATRGEMEIGQDIPRFGMLMGRAILLLGLVVLLVNVACHRPLPQTLLFSFALALGMTPKVMPAIVAIAQKRATRRTQRKEGVSRLLLARGHFGGGATGGPSRATHAAGK